MFTFLNSTFDDMFDKFNFNLSNEPYDWESLKKKGKVTETVSEKDGVKSITRTFTSTDGATKITSTETCYCSSEQQDKLIDLQHRLKVIETKLNNAVSTEDYEQAALLKKDKQTILNKIKNEQNKQ